MRDMVLILNFDAACSRALARALRAEQIYCKIVPGTISSREAAEQEPLGLILAGGDSGSIPEGLDPQLLDGRFPVLALGDTAAMLCRCLGGGALETVLCQGIGAVRFAPCPLTEGIDSCERMLRSVRRLRLPDCARVLASSRDETVGLMHGSLPLYGIQFSLETNDTDGMRLLLNFALNICGCTRWWNFDVYIDRAVSELKRVVGDGMAVCAVTGGLSSGVTALLAQRALGDRVKCVFIDTGLMRRGEGDQVMALYRDRLGLNLKRVQAQDRFLEALSGVADPEQKRAAVHRVLQETINAEEAALRPYTVILRSTTATDLMRGEDADRRPGLRGDAPTVEPLRELFKDEVRQVAERLGMPPEAARRQTFPGSGLALRILGAVSPARLQTLRAVEAIFSDEVSASGLDKRLNRYFAVLSPIPAQEERNVIVLRAVQAGEEAPQAYAARLPYDLLESICQRILRERPEVQRVVYDLTPSSRRTGIEWQ